MNLLNLLFAAVLLSPGPGEEARLATLVAEVRSADYRGARDELRKLTAALDMFGEGSPMWWFTPPLAPSSQEERER
jgi:hypothetical protein